MAISDTLKQKAGPLPVWAWGVILGVVVVAASYWYSSRSSASSADDTASLVAYPDLDGGSSTTSGTTVTNADGSTSTDAAFSSNTAWLTYAVAKLIAEGNSPLSTQIALAHYLSGDTLTAAEQAIVNQAIARFGLPPDGVDVTPTLVETTPAVTTPAVTTPVVTTPVVTTPAPGYTTTKDQFSNAVPILYGQTGYSDAATAQYGKDYEAAWNKKYST